MIWLVLSTVGGGLAAAALAVRADARRAQREALEAQAEAHRLGAHQALKEQPRIDLSKCFGCGACVRACPEDGALALVHGQAALVQASSCVGHAACEAVCPTSAIEVGLGDLASRDDLPVLSDELEALGQPGVFVAGEATAKALIEPATRQGRQVAETVAWRRRQGQLPPGDVELLIVGAGPAGLAAALAAKAEGLSVRWIDRETAAGGTVARYPRKKLVLTRPIELPLAGPLPATEYTKEQLVALWERLVQEHQLRFEGGIELASLERQATGEFLAHTSAGAIRASAVCLAIGRRGSPQSLGVPGEQRPEVSYRLEDAEAYRDRQILIVGGGDSAVEAALALCAQNRVTLSYRREGFFRLKRKNELALEAAISAGQLTVELGSEVLAIEASAVRLRRRADPEPIQLASDEVFLLLGGKSPKELLERCLVPFDPALRQAVHKPEPPPLDRSLFLVCLATLAVALFAYAQRGYYSLPLPERAGHPAHGWLRPGTGLGLGFGIVGLSLVAVNLAYLWRRRQAPTPAPGRRSLGTLSGWLSLHVATGLLALLAALLHSAFAPRLTVGGDAFWLMLGLGLTGAIGRTVYARVPRAANGRELELFEARAELERRLAALDQPLRPFGRVARERFEALVSSRLWGDPSGRRGLAALGAGLRAWVSSRRLLEGALADLDREAQAAGLGSAERQANERLFRRAERAAAAARDLERWRGLLSLWRYLHRWGALLLVLLLLAHLVSALRFGSSFEAARGPGFRAALEQPLEARP